MIENPSGEGRLHSVSRRMLILIPFVAIAIIGPSACQTGSSAWPPEGGYEAGWETVYYGGRKKRSKRGSSSGESFSESCATSYSSSNDNESGDSEYHEQAESHDNEYWEDLEKHD